MDNHPLAKDAYIVEVKHGMVLYGTQRINGAGHLEIGGCDVVELAQRFGTPLFVMDEALIRENCRRYVEALSTYYPSEARIAYAGKAFITTAICRIVHQEGLWLDVASGGELYTAMVAEFPTERIYMHGNYKPLEELELALTNKVHRIVVDSVEELEALNRLANSRHQIADILLRVTPGVEAHTHEYIRTGQIDTKFGIPLAHDQALEAVKRALKMTNLRLHGFHCHIGSQVFELQPYRIAVELMLDFATRVRDETGFVLSELNLGGGLGVRYTDDDKPPTIEEFVKIIADAVVDAATARSLPLPILVLEPGRSIVGEAGTTLYTIGVVKEIPGVRTYVSVDGGMSDNPRPALYDARYHAMVANKASEEATFVCTIAGRHCESDVLIRDARIAPPQPGDILAVFSTGAYHYSMASNYNRFPRPAVVLVKDGNADIIVKREQFEDLVRQDVIPERLQ